MPSIDGRQAVKNLRSAGAKARWPGPDDPRVRGIGLAPEMVPSFELPADARVFTIGSCFARNIEEHLATVGYDIPTLRFAVPKEEWPYRANGLLNEYNPGTICQRIERSFSGETAPDDTIVESGDGWVDLLLPGGSTVSRERAFERRREIDEIYAALPEADFVIVTLGLVEGWLDNATGTYLNRIPPYGLLEDGRYTLEVMDVDDAWPMLDHAFRTITDRGKSAIVTVSPVPFLASFTGRDAIVANGFSKAVLRVCAERLAAMDGVDYLPSYETVTWGGLPNFVEDNIHVRDSVVGEIVEGMVSVYAPHVHAVD